MSNFSLSFLLSPWLMLLIPVAVALTLIPYFRLAKRYRRTRNRIISIVTHLIVMTLCISVLAGLQFNYETPNEDNTVVIVVDISDTSNDFSEKRDEFVNEIISDSARYNCKVGLVAFGFDQELIAQPTTDISSLKNAYKEYFENGEYKCDVNATDIAGAFRKADSLIDKPEAGKIILVSDGKQTDENVLSQIRSYTAKGIKIDVVEPSENFDFIGNSTEVQVCEVSFPQTEISLNMPTTVSVRIKSATDTSVNIQLFDNIPDGTLADPNYTQSELLRKGEQEVSFKYTFKDVPFHEVRVVLSTGGVTDERTIENNKYTTYILIERFDKILIVESNSDDSNYLESLLTVDDEEVKSLLETPFKYDVTRVMVGSQEYKEAIENLTTYDQVILNNVSNANLPDGDIEIIQEYVRDYGGGLLTIGGKNSDGKVNLYNKEDLGNKNDTTYQDMLPVNAIDYTPSLGVAFILDVSGSMAEVLEDYAKDALLLIAQYSLTDRDYMAIFTLDNTYSQVLPLTPRTDFATIRNAILNISGTGGTVATNTIARAAQALTGANVAKKHIIMITDGMFSDGRDEDGNLPYVQEAKNNYENYGISLSVIGINMAYNSEYYRNCLEMTEKAGGILDFFSEGQNANDLKKKIRDYLKVESVVTDNAGKFTPYAARLTDPVMTGVIIKKEDENDQTSSKKLDFSLGGFFGGRIKNNAKLVLSDRYLSPIYAYWEYGKGRVGSFMTDLKGTSDSYSQAYVTDKGDANGIYTTIAGQSLIFGIVRELMPDARIVAGDISCKLTEENYINRLNVYHTLEVGERLEADIMRVNSEDGARISLTEKSEDDGNGVYVTTPFSKDNFYSESYFVVRKAGVYKITIKIIDKDGNEKVSELFKSFSYSKEFDRFPENEGEGKLLLSAIAERSEGQHIESTVGLNTLFDNFEPTIKHVYDPRFLFIIISIIAFLIDIAVRKFKFKWLSEIIREKKELKNVK